MLFKTIKTGKELPFGGVELVKVDKNITEVIVGGLLRIRVANSYSSNLEVLLVAPHETAQRHRVTATIDGFDPKVSYFETEYEAKRAAEDFEAKGATTTVESVEVQIDDSGDVVPDSAATAPDPAASEIPF